MGGCFRAYAATSRARRSASRLLSVWGQPSAMLVLRPPPRFHQQQGRQCRDKRITVGIRRIYGAWRQLPASGVGRQQCNASLLCVMAVQGGAHVSGKRSLTNTFLEVASISRSNASRSQDASYSVYFSTHKPSSNFQGRKNQSFLSRLQPTYVSLAFGTQ